MPRSRVKCLWYDFLQFVCRLIFVTLFRFRSFGREQVPAEGAVIVLSNHQSHLDPIILGVALNRRPNALARASLFSFPPLRWILLSIDTIPLDREGSGLGALKETMRRLKQQELILIFPEGTRSPTGELGRLKSGFVPLARRSGAPLVPVAIHGAFDAWPRNRPFPLPSPITVQFGPPISPEEVATVNDEQLLELVAARINDCLETARQDRRTPPLLGHSELPSSIQ